VSYLIVDEMHHEHPELIKDQYWDEVFPSEWPDTVAAEQFREEHPQPSTANIEVPKAAAEYIIPSSVKCDDMGEHVSLSVSHIQQAYYKRVRERINMDRRKSSWPPYLTSQLLSVNNSGLSSPSLNIILLLFIVGVCIIIIPFNVMY
jgi:hypothetical protein